MTGSRFMLRGSGDLGAKGLAGHPEAYGCFSAAQGRAGEVVEGGYGHRFTIGGLGDDLLGPSWSPHLRSSTVGGWFTACGFACINKQ